VGARRLILIEIDILKSYVNSRYDGQNFNREYNNLWRAKNYEKIYF